MKLLIIFYLYLGSQPIKVNLTDLEIFDDKGLWVHKVGPNYLLALTMPSDKLVMVSPKGELLFQYNRAAQGPGELHHNSVIAVTKDRIYVYSMGVGLLLFDHQLRLLPETSETKRLQRDFAMARLPGVRLNKQEMMLYAHRLQQHHAYIYKLEDAMGRGIWDFDRAEIPKRFPFKGIKDPELANFHEGYLATFQGRLFNHRNQYNVLIYRLIDGHFSPVAELSQSVEDITPQYPPLLASVVGAYKIESGFFVQVVGGHPTEKEMFATTSYYDLFNDDGHFQRRIVKYNHRLVSVPGSAELLEIVSENDDDILVPFQLLK